MSKYNRKTFVIFAPRAFLLSVALLSCSQQGQAQAAPHTDARPVDASPKLVLQFENNLLSAKIDQVPLASVLAALQRETGTAVRFVDPDTSIWLVSTRFEAVPLHEGIKNILDDVSYLYYAEDQTRMLYVLSSAATRQFVAQSGGAPHEMSAELMQAFHSDPSHSGLEQSGLEQLIDQLSANDPDVQVTAVSQLRGVQQDDRAIQALIQVAAGGNGAVADVRVQAASALAQYALAEPAKETASLHALKELAETQNEYVRAVARETLQDIERERAAIAQREREPAGPDADPPTVADSFPEA